jgi:hypothetical protein
MRRLTHLLAYLSMLALASLSGATPAMKAGIMGHPWETLDLLA